MMRRVRSSSNGQIELNLRFSCAIETMSHQHIILPPQLLPLLLTAAQRMANLLGLAPNTVARGRAELLSGQVLQGRVRRVGGGRPRVEKKRPPS